MLPHVTPPTNPTGGGQGSITLYAFAVDAENQRVLLGTRTIVLDNDHGDQTVRRDRHAGAGRRRVGRV